jgi:hypothetical protein
MTEHTRVLLIVSGFTLISAAHVWLLSRAFRRGNGWGTVLFFIPPLALAYLCMRPRVAIVPFLVALVGTVLVLVHFGARYFPRYFVDLGPRLKDVDGEKHLTLTDWNQTDYAAILNAWPDVAVLQMANGDVNDDTLRPLVEFSGLRVLDLDNTQVSDKGLEHLAKLTTLEVLRLRNTRVTDEGFRAHLAGLPALREIYYRGSKIQRPTLMEWKAEKPDSRKVLP